MPLTLPVFHCEVKTAMKNYPLILGGAGMANCCEPVADFFDMFLLGQAEEAAVQLAQFLIEHKKSKYAKTKNSNRSREKIFFYLCAVTLQI